MESSVPTAEALEFPVSGANVRRSPAPTKSGYIAGAEAEARPSRRPPPGLVPLVADLLATAVALAAIAVLDGGSLPGAAVLAPALFVCINWASGLYRLSGGLEPLVSRRIVLDLLLTTALFVWCASLLERAAVGDAHLAPLAEAAIWLGVFASSLLSRVAGENMRRKLSPERWLVVGDPRAAWRLRRALSAKDLAQVVAAEAVPVNGFAASEGRSEAIETLKRLQVDRVVLASGDSDSRTTLGLIHTFKSLGAEISLLPPWLDVLEDVPYRPRLAGGIPILDIGLLTADGNGRAKANAPHPRANGSNGKGAHGRNGNPPRVSVVVPTLNEAENLPHVFDRLPEGLHEVILVDGGSTDDTVQVAKEQWPGVRVLFQTGRGKGDALRTGFAAVTGDIIVMLDADGSADPTEIESFVEQLRAGADFAKGSRFASGGGSDDITPIRQLGNWALRNTVNALYGTRYSDLCYGYNAFWADCLPYIALDVPGFEVETLMNLRVAKAGLKVSEVPSFESNRLYGQSKLSAPRDGLRVLRTILTELSSRSRWNQLNLGRRD